MDEKTLKALKGSIRKWKGIEEGIGEDAGTDNCPLCKLFHRDDCWDCPVCQKTSYQYCEGTPYDIWCEHQDHFHDEQYPFKIIPDCEECKIFAHNEVEFLESLLPQEKQ